MPWNVVATTIYSINLIEQKLAHLERSLAILLVRGVGGTDQVRPKWSKVIMNRGVSGMDLGTEII